MSVLLIIPAAVVLLLVICLIRTLASRPTPAVEATVDAVFDERARRYGEGLGEMIRCETVSDPNDDDRTKFYRFHPVLERLFPNVHRTCERHILNGSLLYHWRGRGEGEPVLFLSHFDVVEATGQWTHAPFGGELIDGKVWGRGTVDTKGNLYCFMQAAEELIAEGYVPSCDIYLASSCTEEHAGEGAPLTVQFLKERGIHLRMTLDEGGMIIENPIGGLRGTYGVVGVLEKGYGDLKFIARSGGGHASMPGKNTPLVRLGKFMADCEAHDPFTPKITPTVEEMLRRFSPNMGFGMRFALCNLWLFRPVLERMMPKLSPMAGAMIKTTLAFTRAKGSDGYNVLPQEAYVTGNLRFIHHQANAESIRIISERAKKYDIETQVLQLHEPGPVVPYDSEQFRLVEETMHEIYPGVGVSPYVMTGGTDSRFYGDICDHSLRFAPLYINGQQFDSIHGLDENIDAAALSKAVDFFRSLMKKL